MVPLIEEVTRLDDALLDLDQIDDLWSVMEGRRSCGIACGESEHHDSLRLRPVEERHVRDQHLGGHIGLARGIDLSIIGQPDIAAVLVLGDSHDGGETFSVVEQLIGLDMGGVHALSAVVLHVVHVLVGACGHLEWVPGRREGVETHGQEQACTCDLQQSSVSGFARSVPSEGCNEDIDRDGCQYGSTNKEPGQKHQPAQGGTEDGTHSVPAVQPSNGFAECE